MLRDHSDAKKQEEVERRLAGAHIATEKAGQEHAENEVTGVCCIQHLDHQPADESQREDSRLSGPSQSPLRQI